MRINKTKNQHGMLFCLRQTINILLLTGSLSTPLHAQDALTSTVLNTPFGPMTYTLPLGYCLMDGREGAQMAKALDRDLPPPPHTVSQRFLPCSDKQRLYESKNWPQDYGSITLSVFKNPSPNAQEPEILWNWASGEREEDENKRLYTAIIGETTQPKISLLPPDDNDWVNDLRSPMLAHWGDFLNAIRHDEPSHLSEHVTIGRDRTTLWEVGYTLSPPHHTLATVNAVSLWKNFRITINLSRPIESMDTYNGLIGDLQPSVQASHILQGEDRLEPVRTRDNTPIPQFAAVAQPKP